MKRFVQVAGALCVAALGCAGQAAAQPQGDRPVSIEVNGGVSMGNKSSGAFGLEGNYAITPTITVFAEVGQIGNVAPKFVSDRANVVAGFLGGTADEKDKATYVDLGVKYMLPMLATHYQPYVGLGIGVAKVAKETTFSISGTSVSEAQLLSQYGVQLGSDLAGSTNKTNVAVLLGITRAIGERLGADVSYRFNRISPKTDVIDGDEAINAQRFQIGVFIRF
jgi:opacity protein-like surface antigen